MLFVAPTVPLQLDVRAVFEDARDPVDRRLVRARDAVQPVGVRLDLLPRAARFAFRLVQRASREELAEVAIALAVLDEEGEVLFFLRSGFMKLTRRLEPDFGSDDRLDPSLFRC